MGLSIKNSTEVIAFNSTFAWNGAYQTKMKYSNNITFFNCTYEASSTTGIAAIDSNEIAVIASYVLTSISSTSVLVGMDSHIDMVVVYFNQSLVKYLDNKSTLKVMNRLTVQVVDSQTLQPIKDASVDVVDAFDVSMGTYTTTPEGLVDGLILDFYQGHDNNSDQDDLDLNERIHFSPHNITASHGGYITGYATPEPYMNTSQMVVIALDKIPVEYIVIQNEGGPGGLNVTNTHFPLGGTASFYAAGYHTSFGYVKDVVVNWITNDSGLATVTSPDKFTTFTASSVYSGPVRVTAWTAGLTTFVDLHIDTAGIDQIIIHNMDYPDAGWVDSRSYDLGMNQTFYAGGYNNTAGYMGPVHAAWSSSNPNVGTVFDTGMSTLFQASTIAHGTTIVTATATNNVNSTGVLTVNPPSVDYIKIESLQDSIGNPVTTRAYLVGETDTFYCAGYNTTTASFVKDVDATWSSSNTGVGTVTSPGTFTTFSAVGAGTAQVNAQYAGMIYRTGDLTVSEQTIIDISIKSIIEPSIPSLDANNISVSAEIENLGNTDIQNVTIDICKNLPDTPDFKNLDSKTIDLLPTANTVTVKFIFGAHTFGAGLHDICILADPLDKWVESDEKNNLANFIMEIVTLVDFIDSIDISPVAITLTADEEVTFTATGIGEDSQSYDLKPIWSVSGGGDIDSTGLFMANEVGDWEVYADFGGEQGKATVTVTPGAVKAVEITEKDILFAVGDKFQFKAIGYDTDSNVIDLSKIGEWFVNGSFGKIDSTGLFEATSAGTGYIGASVTTDAGKVSTELAVTVKEKIYIEKSYDVVGTNADIGIKVVFTKEGNVAFEELLEANLGDEQITVETFGDDLDHIGVFMKIEIPSSAEWDWIIIESNYNLALLPTGVNEEDLAMFYFDEALGAWVKCENTWVDTASKKVFANVTHLTIFAPMADSSGASDQPDDSGGDDAGLSMLMILGLVAVVFVIALAAGVIIVRKKKGTEESKEDEPGDEKEKDLADDATEEELVEREMVEDRDDDIEIIEDEDEGEDVDLASLETIVKNCPGCKSPIDIEPSLAEKVQLECPNCGKKGRMPNPYLVEIERMRESKEEALGIDEDTESADDEDIFADTEEDEELKFD
jgi:hypothetical protein